MDFGIKMTGTDRILDGLKPVQVAQASSRGINKMLPQTKTLVSKTIRREYNIKAADLRNAITTERAHVRKPYGVLKAKGRHLGLIHFDAQHNVRKIGSSARIKKSSGRVIYRGSFIAAPKGGRNVWKRVGKERFPIKRMVGPGVVEMFIGQDVLPIIERFIADKSAELLDHEIGRELDKASGIMTI